METKNEEGTITKEIAPIKKSNGSNSRNTISFHVTIEEKNKIVKNAIDVYGLTISDYIRHKVLEEDSTNKISQETEEIKSEDLVSALVEDVEIRDKEILNLRAQIRSFEAAGQRSGVFIDLDTESFNMLTSIQEYRKNNGIPEIPFSNIFKTALYEFGDKEYWNNQFAKNNGLKYESFEKMFEATS